MRRMSVVATARYYERCDARDSCLVGTAGMRSSRGYEAFISAVAADMGLGDAVHRPGTSVVAADDRSGSSMVVVYWISDHAVLWCDPAIADDLQELADPSASKSQDDISAWQTRVGWEEVSAAHMQLLREGGVVRSTDADSVVIRTLDRDRGEDVALIEAFKGTLSEDDRDEADLDKDTLDEHMLAVVDESGIVALASQQPFNYAAGFGDISIADAARCARARLGANRRCCVVRRDRSQGSVSALPVRRREPRLGQAERVDGLRAGRQSSRRHAALIEVPRQLNSSRTADSVTRPIDGIDVVSSPVR